MELSVVQPNIYAKEVQKFPSKRCFVAVLDVSGEERCVTSDDPNNGCEGDYLRMGRW